MHKLMRVAFEDDAGWIVEVLEHEREYIAAKLTFALADYEERVGRAAL